MNTVEELGALRLVDKSSDTLYLRTGVTLAFFLPMPFAKGSEQVGRVAEMYFKFIPPGSLKWASVGADSETWSALKAKTFEKCVKLCGADGASERELTAFEIGDGGNEGGDAPGFGIKVVGNPPDDDLPLEQNMIEMHFPWEYAFGPERAKLVEFARAAAALLPYYSGYAAPALQWAEAKATMAFDEAAEIIKRHPGLDISQNELGRSDLGDKTRGGRWLTFIGPEVVKALGGKASIDKALGADIAVQAVGGGLMLRASDAPELGDKRQSGDGIPRLRRVVELLRPVTLDEAAIFESYFDDDTFSKVWAERFTP